MLSGLTIATAMRQNGRAIALANRFRNLVTMVKDAAAKRYAGKVVRQLRNAYPEADCALVHKDAFQLLMATILSAQCTDERVNLVTQDLFARYPTAFDLAQLSLTKLERAIKSTGFFRNKAKNIKACCRRLVDDFDGQVPADFETLVQLPGVGRKTANVVMGTAFGVASGVVVDTHVGRISRRLGLTQQADPVKVERDLMEALPRQEWIMFSHRMIHHGRRVCKARSPQCQSCNMLKFCPQIGIEP